MPKSQAKQAPTLSRLLQSRRQTNTTFNIWSSPVRHLFDLFTSTRTIETSAARGSPTSNAGDLLAVLTQNITQVGRRNGRWPGNVLAGCGVFLVEFEVLRLMLVEVLAWVCGLVFEDLDEAVEADGDEGTEGWA